MAQINPGGLGELRGVGASKGVALTNSASHTVLPLGTRYISLTPRNFASSAVVVRVLTNPWLVIAKTSDLLVDAANFTDYSEAAQDSDVATSVVLSDIDTFANGDALYVGSHVPFAGVVIDVDAVNGTSSILTVKYRKNDDSWTDISDLDGTIDTGKSMAQDGSVTWTVPSDWTTTSLIDSEDCSIVNFGWGRKELYWTRWEWSEKLDASVTLDSMTSINRSTAYAELVTGQNFEQAVNVGEGGISNLQMLTDTGTANLVIVASATGRHV